MFGAPVSQGLTLSKVISGISKTLGIANQVIPLYREAKPMIQNARSIMGVLKTMSKTPSKIIETKENSATKIPQKTPEIKKVENTSPTFFL